MYSRPGKNLWVPAQWCTDTILRPTNHDALGRDGTEYNKLNKSNISVEITAKFSFISLKVIYLIYAMHAQNGDMSVLPSLHLQLKKI